MKLIIAEKPNLARNIISAIGPMKKQDGFYLGEEYIVTWAFGHLFSLADVEDYLPEEQRSSRWTPEVLPCFPDRFVFRLRKDASKQVDAGVIKQFETIRSLCNREDVDTLVNAGDSDREGEIIIRICVQQALKSPKPFLRLWLPDQTEETVREALANMKSESDYDSLANEGFARTYIDWLYGVNLTRFATLKTGTLLRVGRVIVPVVKAVYDRDMAIRNFVPEHYWAPVSKTGEGDELIELVSKRKFDFNDLNKAQELCDAYNRAGATVVSVKKKKDTLSPGKLYSLSKLQNFLGKKYKMNMSENQLRVSGHRRAGQDQDHSAKRGKAGLSRGIQIQKDHLRRQQDRKPLRSDPHLQDPAQGTAQRTGNAGVLRHFQALRGRVLQGRLHH